MVAYDGTKMMITSLAVVQHEGKMTITSPAVVAYDSKMTITSLGVVAYDGKQGSKLDQISTCLVGQLAKNSTSPSQKYHLSFLLIVKQGHSSSRTSSVNLNSSFPDCWSSQMIRRVYILHKSTIDRAMCLCKLH